MGAIQSAFESLPLPTGTPSAGEVPAATGVGAASAWAPRLALQAATPEAGFALQNGTPTIISWTAPNDGNQHRAAIFGSAVVTSAQTGGALQATFTPPGGAAHSISLGGGGLTAGSYSLAATVNVTVAPGTTVSVSQASAQTVGAATVNAEIWGS